LPGDRLRHLRKHSRFLPGLFQWRYEFLEAEVAARNDTARDRHAADLDGDLIEQRNAHADAPQLAIMEILKRSSE